MKIFRMAGLFFVYSADGGETDLIQSASSIPARQIHHVFRHGEFQEPELGKLWH